MDVLLTIGISLASFVAGGSAVGTYHAIKKRQPVETIPAPEVL